MKDQTLHEIVEWRIPSGATIDPATPIIPGVKILGLESRNGRTYLPECAARAASLYENMRVNVNHPHGDPMGPRDYRDRLGVLRGVTVKSDGLYADFHLNPKHALAEQLLWDAEHSPESVGFSHNVTARTARKGDRVVVEEITKVISVDLVADPATTKSLFESITPLKETTVAKTVKQIVEAAQGNSLEKRLLVQLLKEEDFAPMGDAPVDVPAEASPDDQMKAAFKTALMAVLDMDPWDMTSAVTKLKDIVKAYDSLQGGGKTPTEEPPAEGGDATEAADLRKQLAELQGREEARELLTEAKLPQNPAWVKALAALPKADRQAFVESLPRGQVQTPRSAAPRQPITEQKDGETPKTAEEFASAIAD